MLVTTVIITTVPSGWYIYTVIFHVWNITAEILALHLSQKAGMEKKRSLTLALHYNFLMMTMALLLCNKFFFVNSRLTHISSGDNRLILHFHYTTWPDFGVPQSPEAFYKFLNVVRASGVLEPDVGPAVVHCSAGIGRSGTFCLVDTILMMVITVCHVCILSVCNI